MAIAYIFASLPSHITAAIVRYELAHDDLPEMVHSTDVDHIAEGFTATNGMGWDVASYGCNPDCWSLVVLGEALAHLV